MPTTAGTPAAAGMSAIAETPATVQTPGTECQTAAVGRPCKQVRQQRLV